MAAPIFTLATSKTNNGSSSMRHIIHVKEADEEGTIYQHFPPAQTRIVTKYNVPNLESAKYQKPKKRKREPEHEDAGKDAAAPLAPRIPKAALTLKTFDPESGVVLKFKTDRAADVGRLIAGLGRLSRHMAALPEKVEDVPMPDAAVPVKEEPGSTDAPHAGPVAAEKPQQQQQQQQPGAGKKKKKGKR